MEIALRVISSLIISLCVPILVGKLYPVFLKREQANEEEAKSQRIVCASKTFSRVFVSLVVILNLVGIVIVALPKFISEYLGFNYVATVCFWWVMMLFDDAVVYFFSTKAVYDDEKIIVKKLLRKPRTYYYSDVISFTRTRNLTVVTTKGKFMLFNALSGTNGLRQVLAEKTKQN